MKTSAGILLYRIKDHVTEFFLVHPGGPFWKNRDDGAWSIPKGEFTGEEPLDAAIREFKEETGHTPKGPFITLAPIQQKGGKLVHAFACEGNIDPQSIRSNTFQIEWPYRSGKWQSFPEVDKAGWFQLPEAARLINPSQLKLLEELVALLGKR